ncbi:ABC transporter ATP-binding protein [bacterium]|nr:ABC transporter ATP-binding protein [bacterium]
MWPKANSPGALTSSKTHSSRWRRYSSASIAGVSKYGWGKRFMAPRPYVKVSGCANQKRGLVAVIIAENLVKSFGDTRALGPVTFSIPAGSHIALTGRSGSGKSTLLSLLGCLDTPTSGRLEIAGINTAGLGDAALSQIRLRQIGFIHQFFDLVSDLTAFENVMVPFWLAGEPLGEPKASELLKKLGLAHRLNHLTGDLSGGEQQRVAVARAVALGPKIILADEPTGSLDSRTGAAVMDLIIETATALGATLIVATHSPEVTARLPGKLTLLDGALC